MAYNGLPPGAGTVFACMTFPGGRRGESLNRRAFPFILIQQLLNELRHRLEKAAPNPLSLAAEAAVSPQGGRHSLRQVSLSLQDTPSDLCAAVFGM
jgi:hypothetical protein